MRRLVPFAILVLASCGTPNVPAPPLAHRAETVASSNTPQVEPRGTLASQGSSTKPPRVPHALVATKVEGVPEDLVRDALAVDCVVDPNPNTRTIAILKRRVLTLGSFEESLKWSPSTVYPLPLRNPRPRDPIAWFEHSPLASTERAQPNSTIFFSSESGGFRWDRRSPPVPINDPPTAKGWQLGNVDAISSALLANPQRVYESWRAERRSVANRAPEVVFDHGNPRTADVPSVPRELGIPGAAIAIGDLKGDGAVAFAFSNNGPPLPSRRSNPAEDVGPDALTIVRMPDGTTQTTEPKPWISVFSFATAAIIHAIGICHVDDPSIVFDTPPGLVFVAGRELWWVR